MKKRTNYNVGKKNNPPNPPYINLDGLKYIAKIYHGNDNDFKHEIINDFFKKLKSYPFYETILNSGDIAHLSQINESAFYKNKGPGFYNSDILPKLYELIAFIDRNNSSTLIGTYENTDLLQTISYTDTGCSTITGEDTINNKIKKIKHNNYLDIINQLKHQVNSRTDITETDSIAKLKETKNENENDKMLYDILTGDSIDQLKTFFYNNFEKAEEEKAELKAEQEAELKAKQEKAAQEKAEQAKAEQAKAEQAKAEQAKAASRKGSQRSAAKRPAAKKQRGGQNTTFKKRTRKNITLKN